MRPADTTKWQPPEELPFAWTDANALYRSATEFFAHEDMKRALEDRDFRLGEFRTKKPTHLPTKSFDVTQPDKHYRDYFTVLADIKLAANNTQKKRAKGNAPWSMQEMRELIGNASLLLNDVALFLESEALQCVFPNKIIDGLQISVVLAVKAILILEEKGTRIPVAESHGLFTVAGFPDQPELTQKIPPINQMATTATLEEGYRYGGLETEELGKRLQGIRFRAMDLWEFSDKTLKASRFPLPQNSARSLIFSDVCTFEEIMKGTHPTFFAGQWGMRDLIAPVDQRIDLSKGNCSAQLMRALDPIAKMIKYHPLDNPVIRS